MTGPRLADPLEDRALAETMIARLDVRPPLGADRRLLLYLLVAAYFVPLGLVPEVIVSIVVVGSTAGALFVAAVGRSLDPTAITAMPPIAAMVADLVWSVSSTGWAQDPVLARQSVVQFALSTALAVLIITQIVDRPSLDRLMGSLALGGWGLLGVSVLLVAQNGFVSGTRFTVFDTNENQFTLLLILGALGVLWPAVLRPVGERRWAVTRALVYLLIASLLIAASGSRGGLLSVAILLLALVPFRATRRWGLAGVVGGALSVVLAPDIYATVLSRILEPDAALSRSTLADAAVALIADHPATGVGVGNGPTAMVAYIRPLVDTDLLGRNESYPAHNPLLEVAADTGLVGLGLYLILIGSAAALWAIGAGTVRHRPASGAFALVVLTGATSAAYGASWFKSGGVSHGPTFFVLVALWVVCYRFCVLSTEELP